MIDARAACVCPIRIISVTGIYMPLVLLYKANIWIVASSIRRLQPNPESGAQILEHHGDRLDDQLVRLAMQ